MCEQTSLAKHPHILVLGSQERFIGDFQWGIAVPLLHVHVGLLSSLFYLKYEHNDLGGKTDLVHAAVPPNDLHLTVLHWD